MLTIAKIKATRPANKPIKLHDGGGLYLLVQPNNARWWRWDYRRPVTGKRNTLSFGTYPDIGLADARGRRDEARRLLKLGSDPGEQRKAEKAAGAERATHSFEVVAREWLGMQTWVDAYKVKVVAWFQNDVFPYIGTRPIAELGARDFLAVARRIEARGAIESARRIMQNCGQVMVFAIASQRAERNPVPDLRKALATPVEKNHAAITTPAEVGALLRAIDGYAGTAATRCALQLAPLVFVRPGELRHAEWSEIDLDAAEWLIPANKMKMRKEHLVPLSRQAVAILRNMHLLTGRGRYVFPSARDPKRAMSNNAVLAALRRMGFTGEEMTGHGFRAMARTILDEVLGLRPDIIEHQLAHEVKDPNGNAYNRATYLPYRRRMMQRWADYLDDLRKDDKSRIDADAAAHGTLAGVPA